MNSSVSFVVKKGGENDDEHGYFSTVLQLFGKTTIHQNVKQDADYLEASEAETEFCNRFENLALPKERKETIRQWIEAIHAQNAAYTMAVFRMAMQCCFSLLIQLTDLR